MNNSFEMVYKNAKWLADFHKKPFWVVCSDNNGNNSYAVSRYNKKPVGGKILQVDPSNKGDK